MRSCRAALQRRTMISFTHALGKCLWHSGVMMGTRAAPPGSRGDSHGLGGGVGGGCDVWEVRSATGCWRRGDGVKRTERLISMSSRDPTHFITSSFRHAGPPIPLLDSPLLPAFIPTSFFFPLSGAILSPLWMFQRLRWFGIWERLFECKCCECHGESRRRRKLSYSSRGRQLSNPTPPKHSALGPPFLRQTPYYNC